LRTPDNPGVPHFGCTEMMETRTLQTYWQRVPGSPDVGPVQVRLIVPAQRRTGAARASRRA